MIIDSSSLIIFAKLNKLDILLKLYENIDITKEIYKETVQEGLIIEAPDSKIIKECVENKKIKIIELKKEYEDFSAKLREKYYQLGIGESESIALAIQEKERIIIMDEKIGRQVCKLYGLKPIGSLRILLNAYKNNIVSESELRDIINEMVKYKFRPGGDILNEFWVIFEKIKKKRRH